MSQMPTLPSDSRFGLHRSPRGKMVAGICAGLAEKTGFNVWIFRVLFIVGTFTFGPGLLVYAIMFFLLPMDRR